MTALALVLAPVAAAVVLLVSGWAKVGDVTGTRLAFVAMHVPTALTRRTFVRALPFAELGLAVALLVTWGWLLAVVGAVVTVLFVGYAVLVARVLQAGESVACHCFGSLGDDRVTTATLARNVVLVVLAALATAFGAGGSGVIPAARDLDGADWWWPTLTALVVLAAVLVVRPAPPGELAEELPEEEELDYLRQPIPVGVLVAEDGERVQLRHLAARRPQLVVFMSVGCGACHVLADLLPDIARRLKIVAVASVFTDTLDSVPASMRAAETTLWHDPDSAVTDLFTSARPAAVLFGADGMLAGGPVFGTREIEGFVDDIVAELEAAPPELVPDEGQPHHDHDHDHQA